MFCSPGLLGQESHFLNTLGHPYSQGFVKQSPVAVLTGWSFMCAALLGYSHTSGLGAALNSFQILISIFFFYCSMTLLDISLVGAFWRGLTIFLDFYLGHVSICLGSFIHRNLGSWQRWGPPWLWLRFASPVEIQAWPIPFETEEAALMVSESPLGSFFLILKNIEYSQLKSLMAPSCNI